MRTELLNLLTSDTTLMGLLTGGVYDAVAVDHISKVATPDAFDADSELLPCAIVKLDSEQPVGPFHYSTQVGFSIYLYQRFGRDLIDLARARCITLLHRQRIADVEGWQVWHGSDVLNQWDAALDCPMLINRYTLPLHRQPTTGLSALLTENGEVILTEAGEIIYA